MSKRREGFPSETQVKRGVRIINVDKLLEEKLGRNDLCPDDPVGTVRTHQPVVQLAAGVPALAERGISWQVAVGFDR